MAMAKQGGYEEAEFDSATGFVTFTSKRPGVKTRRVHVTNTSSMVFGATLASADKPPVK